MIVKAGTLMLLVAAATACGGKKSSGGSTPAQPTATPAPADSGSGTTTTDTSTTGGSTTTTTDTSGTSTTTSGTSTSASAGLYQPKNTPAKLGLALPGSLALSDVSSLRLQEDMVDAEAQEYDPELGDIEAGGGDYDPFASESPTDAAPDAQESQGFGELSRQLETLSDRLSVYTKELSAIDQIIEANADDCADGCEIADAQTEISAEMVNSMIAASGGEDFLSSEELEGLDSLIGATYTLGTVTVEQLTDDPAGFVEKITLDDGYGRTLEFLWDEDKNHVRIKEDSSGSWSEGQDMLVGNADAYEGGEVAAEMEADMAAPGLQDSEEGQHTFETSYVVEFDEELGVMSVKDESNFDGMKYNNAFTFQVGGEDAAALQDETEDEADEEDEDESVFFSVKIDYDDPQGYSSYYGISGFADDLGAYMHSIYSFDMFTFTFTADGTLEMGASYMVLPVDTEAADLNMDNIWTLSLGSLYGDGDGESASGFYSGPETLPGSGLPLFTETWAEGEDGNWSASYAAAGINLTDIGKVVDRSVFGYEEIIDADGVVTGFCAYSLSDDTRDWPAAADLPTADFCSEAWDDSNTYAGFYEEQAGDGGSFAIVGELKVGIYGADWSNLLGDSVYILSSADAVTALNAAWATDDAADDEAAWAGVLGNGYYLGVLEYGVDPAGEHTADEDINDLYELYPWATEEALNADGVVLARYGYNEETFLPELTLVTDAGVFAYTTTADNASVDVSDVIETEVPEAAAE